MARGCRSAQTIPLKAFWNPWFPTAETSHLQIILVQDRESLAQAFALASIPDIRQGMEFPTRLTWNQFEATFHRQPRKDIFLLKEKASGHWAGLVIFWPAWATTLCGVRQRQLHQCMG